MWALETDFSVNDEVGKRDLETEKKEINSY